MANKNEGLYANPPFPLGSLLGQSDVHNKPTLMSSRFSCGG